MGPSGPYSSKEVLPQIIFFVIVLPLSCLERDEQVTVQSIMAIVRFVVIFIIIFGSALALLIDDSRSDSRMPPYWSPQQTDGCKMSYSICFSRFCVAFSTSLFSQLFQHSIPGLLRPLRGRPNMIVQVPASVSGKCCVSIQFLISIFFSQIISLTYLKAHFGRIAINYFIFLSSSRYDRCCLLWSKRAPIDQFKFFQLFFRL